MRSTAPSRRTRRASFSIEDVAAALAALADIATEGRNIILIMLATGAVFLTVVVGGDLLKWARHKRKRY